MRVARSPRSRSRWSSHEKPEGPFRVRMPGRAARRQSSEVPMPTALIADDEPLLRAQMKARLAEAWPELKVVAEAGNGAEAIELAARHEPDVAFLDIRMPVKSGLDVARALGGRCHVVFVTAYDEYAIAAFDEGAVDYILKPPAPERVATLVARLKARLTGGPRDLEALIARLAGSRRGPAALAPRVARAVDAPHRRRRRPLLPGRGQVHAGRHRRRRRADQEADQRALRRARRRSRSGRSTAGPSSTCGRSRASTATGAASR